MSPASAQARAFDRFENLADAFRDLALKQPERALYSQPREVVAEDGKLSREWAPTTYGASLERIEKLAGFLESLGVGAGLRVAILSNTRPEWGEAELAVYRAGGSVVTAYATDPAERNGYVIFDSGARVAFVENQEQLDKLISISRSEFKYPATEERPEGATRLDLKHIVAFEKVDVPADFAGKVTELSVVLSGAAASAAPSAERRSLGRADEATIVYTSGTTGAPKGVVATHGQHLANLRQVVESGLAEDVNSVLHVLPQAHGFGLRMVHLTALAGVEGRFPAVPDPKSSELNAQARNSLTRDMREANAEIVPAVPKMLERMRDGVMAKVSSMGWVARNLMKLTIDTYSKIYDEKEGGPKASTGTKIAHAVLEAWPLRIGPKLQEKVREQLVGKEFKFFVTGGAALPRNVAVFFGALGMPAYEGYGSTETNVPVTVNTPRNHRLGSVGKRMADDIEFRLSDRGELLVRGPNNASGYYGREAATKKTWEADGWYHTRDAAEIDADGYLFLKGRVDDVMKTTTGEFIQPAPIEEKIKTSRFVTEAVLVGHSRPCCVALVTLNEAAVREWAAANAYEIKGDPRNDPAVQRIVRQDVMSITNDTMERKFEWVRNVGIIPDLTIGNGLTPTFKVQREKVIKMHDKLVDSLYKDLKVGNN